MNVKTSPKLPPQVEQASAEYKAMRDQILALKGFTGFQLILDYFTREKDRNYYYPRRELDNVIRNFKRRKFEVEVPPAEKQASLSLIPSANAGPVAEAEIQTPPLPATPSPDVASTTNLANVNVVNPLTNLTQAEQALLSPGEQAIAQRINRRV